MGKRRINRPDTWQHRPTVHHPPKNPCQQGAVHTWHLADVPLALMHVCFERKNGHAAGVTPFPLMTHSGRFLE
jgi:hypothetical protein